MANVHPCQVECTLMAFAQTASMEIWSSLMVLWERVITPWSKLICFLPDELLYFIVGWHLKVIMALLTLDHSSCSTASFGCQLLSRSISLRLRRCCGCLLLKLDGTVTRQWHGQRAPYGAPWLPPSTSPHLTRLHSPSQSDAPTCIGHSTQTHVGWAPGLTNHPHLHSICGAWIYVLISL